MTNPASLQPHVDAALLGERQALRIRFPTAIAASSGRAGTSSVVASGSACSVISTSLPRSSGRQRSTPGAAAAAQRRPGGAPVLAGSRDSSSIAIYALAGVGGGAADALGQFDQVVAAAQTGLEDLGGAQSPPAGCAARADVAGEPAFPVQVALLGFGAGGEGARQHAPVHAGLDLLEIGVAVGQHEDRAQGVAQQRVDLQAVLRDRVAGPGGVTLGVWSGGRFWWARFDQGIRGAAQALVDQAVLDAGGDVHRRDREGATDQQRQQQEGRGDAGAQRGGGGFTPHWALAIPADSRCPDASSAAGWGRLVQRRAQRVDVGAQGVAVGRVVAPDLAFPGPRGAPASGPRAAARPAACSRWA
ncbi:hypothetical protein Ddc_19754 [Ditylenchus destructor]|nr:hypothetical protein Ddc_19754 [Ditylenchus destructor]